jgi:hypothetical protein
LHHSFPQQPAGETKLHLSSGLEVEIMKGRNQTIAVAGNCGVDDRAASNLGRTRSWVVSEFHHFGVLGSNILDPRKDFRVIKRVLTAGASRFIGFIGYVPSHVGFPKTLISFQNGPRAHHP